MVQMARGSPSCLNPCSVPLPPHAFFTAPSFAIPTIHVYFFNQFSFAYNQPRTMKPVVIVKLSFMMLLEYFVWGAWYVTLSNYMAKNLDASAGQIGSAYNALAIATMIS